MRYVTIPKPRIVRSPLAPAGVSLSLHGLLADVAWGALAWRADEGAALAFGRVADAFHAEDDELAPGAVVELSDSDHERLANVLRSVEIKNQAITAAATRLLGAILTASAEPPK